MFMPWRDPDVHFFGPYFEALLLELTGINGPVHITHDARAMTCISGTGKREVIGNGTTFQRAIENCAIALMKRESSKMGKDSTYPKWPVLRELIRHIETAHANGGIVPKSVSEHVAWQQSRLDD